MDGLRLVGYTKRCEGIAISPLWSYLVVGTALVLLGLAACRAVSSDPPTDDEFVHARAALLDELRREGIADPRVLHALDRVPRHEFVRSSDRTYAYANQPLPIGGGQTISQPLIVALMTQLLGLKGDERVLEVGTGSGYQAAVIAMLAREVYTIEIDATLAASAEERLRRLGYANVHVRAGDGFFGWPQAAPFDAVIITAVAPRIPERLLEQLKPNGVLVMPLGDDYGEQLIRAHKRAGAPAIEYFGDVAFVPMTGAVRTPTEPSP